MSFFYFWDGSVGTGRVDSQRELSHAPSSLVSLLALTLSNPRKKFRMPLNRLSIKLLIHLNFGLLHPTGNPLFLPIVAWHPAKVISELTVIS